METAYFKSICKEIIDRLSCARHEIVIAMAWFTSDDLFSAVADALKRRVKVELILLDNATNFMPYAPDFNEIIALGGVLRIASSAQGFLHHKYCVIDNQLVITGSYNWTYYAEARNMENIIVSDNPDVVALYRNDFNALTSIFPVSGQCPRLSWEDIQASESIDFQELNYEIERISHVRNFPVRKVFKSNTVVQLVDESRKFKSNYTIGIQAGDASGRQILIPFIEKGHRIPWTSEPRELFCKDNSDIKCRILWADEGDTDDSHCVVERSLNELVEGHANDEKKVSIVMSLKENGYLQARITAPDGRALDVSTIELKLVGYED